MATDMTLASNNTMSQNLSYTSGPTDKTLWTVTLGALAEIQAEVFGDRTALVFPWQDERRTYRELFLRSNTIAKSLLESGLQHGDCVGIFAGNCISYLEVFLGASFIGCPVVVLNINYTPAELDFTVEYSGEPKPNTVWLLLSLTSFTRMQAPVHRAIPWAQ
jgi:acyl-CoA synthetase (AMP-forming)/AMP-acid ligase II